MEASHTPTHKICMCMCVCIFFHFIYIVERYHSGSVSLFAEKVKKKNLNGILELNMKIMKQTKQKPPIFSITNQSDVSCITQNVSKGCT